MYLCEYKFLPYVGWYMCDLIVFFFTLVKWTSGQFLCLVSYHRNCIGTHHHLTLFVSHTYYKDKPSLYLINIFTKLSKQQIGRG